MSAQEVKTEQEKLTMSSMSTRLGRKIIEIDGISKRYGEKQLIHNFTYNLLRGDRIGIIGANGCGKSTLLKIMLGTVAPDSGTVTVGETVRIGYFSQECEEMDTGLRAIDYIRDISPEAVTPDGTLTAAQMMEKFLFTADLQYSLIGRLSGGERRRLYLLGVLMQAPNVLLFDEPTNDLDIQTLTILEDYLRSFSGAVVVVSHDRYFLDKVAEHIFAFERGGEIHDYAGGYSDYLTFQKPEQEDAAPKAKESRPKTAYRQKSDKLKFTFKEQREYGEIDAVIAGLEEKIAGKEREIAKEASNYVLLSELIAEKDSLEAELDAQTERWVYLNDLADRIAQQNSGESS